MQGTIYPVNLELYVRGIFTSYPDNKSVYFNTKYVEEAVSWFKGQAGTFSILAASPGDVSKIASAVDDMFRNSPQPTKSESEKAFGLEFVAMMGNVKAFILMICAAVVFATLLVSANTWRCRSANERGSGGVEDIGIYAAERAGSVRE